MGPIISREQKIMVVALKGDVRAPGKLQDLQWGLK